VVSFPGPPVFIHQVAERNCPKSLGRAYNVALRATETVLFGSFWTPYSRQVYDRSVAYTPFRTVSDGRFSETQGSYASVSLKELMCPIKA
jgi:hypothetical protein